LLIAANVEIASFLVLTFNALPIFDFDTRCSNVAPAVASIGSVAHGMLRVFKSEVALGPISWSMDLPAMHEVNGELASGLILEELLGRIAGKVRDGLVAYRFLKQGQTAPERLTQVLQPMTRLAPQPVFLGVAVIAGMGRVAIDLADGLVGAGIDSIVFLGRRDPNSHSVSLPLFLSCHSSHEINQVHQQFVQMEPRLRCKASYHQVDITNSVQLEAALKAIHVEHGSIRHLIHTAAVVRDASIANVSPALFEEVLQPKVRGAWNLHQISQRLSLTLNTFVMLSSTKCVSLPIRPRRV